MSAYRRIVDKVEDVLTVAVRPAGTERNESTASGREPLPDRDGRADWDADNSGVRSAKLRYDNEIQSLEYEFDDVKLEIGNDDEGEVTIIAEENSEHWRSVVIRFDGETADEVADQLELAAEMARKGQGADIRT